MKRLALLFGIALAAVALTGCGGSSAVNATATETGSASAAAPSWSKSGPPPSIPEPEWKAAGASLAYGDNVKVVASKLHTSATAGKCVVEKIGISEGLRLLAFVVALYKHEAAAEAAARKALATCTASGSASKPSG